MNGHEPRLMRAGLMRAGCSRRKSSMLYSHVRLRVKTFI